MNILLKLVKERNQHQSGGEEKEDGQSGKEMTSDQQIGSENDDSKTSRESDMELSEEQKNAILPANDSGIIVKGGPGTGKTIIALRRAQEVIDNKEELYNKVILLTFTRELERNLQRLASENVPELRREPAKLEIQTFDA